MQPTEPGWYWAKFHHKRKWMAVEVRWRKSGELAATIAAFAGWVDLSEFTDWRGPLVPPGDPSSLEDRVKAIEQWIDKRENYEQEQNERG
jgi:hypothetical protein